MTVIEEPVTVIEEPSVNEEAMVPRVLYRDMRGRAEEIADEILKKQVLAGIEFLNEHYGPDWVDHIDPAKLSMSRADSCVLGQLYGEYQEGCQELGIAEETELSARRFGFFVSSEHELTTTNCWQFLTSAWKKVLA